MACAPNKDSDQPGHPSSLIRVFAVHMKKARVLSYPLSTQRRRWSDWGDAQADLSLRWVHSHFVGFHVLQFIFLVLFGCVWRISIRTVLRSLSNDILCFRLRAPKNKPGAGSQGKGGGSGKKGEKGLERQQSRILRSMPFHRRHQINDDLLQYDVDMFMPHVAAPNAACVPPSGPPAQGVGNSQGSQVVMNNSGEVVASNMDSPASNAPSPLVEPYNQQMDSASNSGDPTMPTLSPHPPSKTGEKDQSAKTQTTESLNTNVTNNSALVNGVAPENVFTKPHIHVAPKTENVTSPYSWNQQTLENTKANINSWLRSQQRQVEDKGLKRPSLPTVHSDSDEIVTDSLYNFDSVYNW